MVVEGLGHTATPRREAGAVRSACARARAAFDRDLEKRFGHDLDPLKGGSASRHRSSAPRLARRMRLGATASFQCPEQGPRLRAATRQMRLVYKTLARTRAARITPVRTSPLISHGEQFLTDVPEIRTRHNRNSNREQHLLTARSRNKASTSLKNHVNRGPGALVSLR